MLRILTLAALLASLAAQPSLAADAPLWATVGNWQIRVDETLNYGCFMVGSYERGDVLRIGLDFRSGANGYILVGNATWKSLEVGKEYQLSVQF